jgi:hypothetical protein
VAFKSGQEGTSNKDIEEMLDAVDHTLDRLKTLYEQYFLGIQKQAPAFIHSDVERKLRDLTQLNLRNTSLRYRLATLQQKFGSYNSYWRRTLRQIENGTYARNLAKIGREAAKKGADIPEEILAAMPKRMREQVLRDRDAAIAIAKRRNQVDEPAPSYDDDDEPAAIISDAPRAEIKSQSGAHILSEDDGDLDFEKLFSAFEDDAPKAPAPKPVSQTQQMTRPIERPFPQVNDDTDPGFAFDLDAAQREAQSRPTGAIPRPVAATPTQSTAIPKPIVPTPSGTTAIPRPPAPQHPVTRQTGPVPIPAVNTPTSAIPKPMAPSQASRPNPIVPGAALRTGPVPVESMSGPFPRAQTPDPSTTPPGAPAARPTPPVRPTPPAVPRPAPPNTPTQAMPKTAPPNAPTQAMPKPTATQPVPRPTPNVPRPPAGPPQKPPPGMTDADVNALHAKYVQAKQMVGEKVDPGSREKLLRTINQTAPKIMEQYKASGVDFSVVVKDNQVVIKAKPKT